MFFAIIIPNSHAVGFQSLGLDLVQHFTAAKIRNTWRWNRWNLWNPLPWNLCVSWTQGISVTCGTSSTHGVPQVPSIPWVQPGHWFHRFHTGSLGSARPLVWQVPDRFLGFKRSYPKYILLNAPLFRTIFGKAGIRFWQECFSRIETTPLVPQVPDRFLGFNHATGSTASRQVPWVQTAMVPQVPRRFFGFNTPLVPQVPHRFLGFNHVMGSTGELWRQTVVLFNVPLSINQQWEPWSLGNLVSHSSCLPIILEPCFLWFCLPSLCY